MKTHEVTIFKPYPLEAGQKINIEDGPRKGDWLVVETTERKVTLRCPISLKEFTWDRFCYFTEERQTEVWPQK